MLSVKLALIPMQAREFTSKAIMLHKMQMN